MQRYYHLTTDGPDTNLQLYSLRQAAKYWSALCAEVTAGTYVEDFHERCAFVICTVGLSVSQLLGQNIADPTATIPSPSKIFRAIVTGLDDEAQLVVEFQRFIKRYDQCRHFGRTVDDSRHHEVSQVTFDETKWVFEFGLQVWKIVIQVCKQDPRSELEDLDLEALLGEA